MIDFFQTVWASSVGNKIMLIAAMVMIVVIIASLIYTLARGKRDAGFMKTESGSQIAWDKSSFPLNVFIDPELPEMYVAAVSAARRDFNLAMNREVFGFPQAWMLNKLVTSVYDVPRESIYVALQGTNSGPGGENEYRYESNGRLLSCFLTASPRLSPKQALAVITHELGHSLGLDHDGEVSSSIMYPVLHGRTQELTKKDRARLRSFYA